MSEQSLIETIDLLKAELAELRAKVTHLEAVKSKAANPDQAVTSRRRVLKRLALGMLATGVGVTALPHSVEARLISGPNPGTVVIRNGASVVGNLPTDPNNAPYRYGLVASSDDSLDFGNLVGADTSVSGVNVSPLGIGVYGYSGSQDGIAIYGTNSDGIAISGETLTGTAIYAGSLGGVSLAANSDTGVGVSGASNGGIGVEGYTKTSAGVRGFSDENGIGVYGRGTNGYGLVAESANAAPLRIVAKGTGKPTITPDVGALWVNNAGNLYIYTGATNGWRQVQYI